MWFLKINSMRVPLTILHRLLSYMYCCCLFEKFFAEEVFFASSLLLSSVWWCTKKKLEPRRSPFASSFLSFLCILLKGVDVEDDAFWGTAKQRKKNRQNGLGNIMPAREWKRRRPKRTRAHLTQNPFELTRPKLGKNGIFYIFSTVTTADSLLRIPITSDEWQVKADAMTSEPRRILGILLANAIKSCTFIQSHTKRIYLFTDGRRRDPWK